MACCACPICFCFPCKLETQQGNIPWMWLWMDNMASCNLANWTQKCKTSCNVLWKKSILVAPFFAQHKTHPCPHELHATFCHLNYLPWSHGSWSHGTCVLAEVLDWCWVLWSHPLQPRRHWCRGDPKQVRVKLMVKHGESNKTSWHVKAGSNIVVKSFICCTLTILWSNNCSVIESLISNTWVLGFLMLFMSLQCFQMWMLLGSFLFKCTSWKASYYIMRRVSKEAVNESAKKGSDLAAE